MKIELFEMERMVAFGGAFYAVVEAQPLGVGLTPAHHNALIDYGRRIKVAVMDNFSVKHPFEDELSFLYGTILIGPSEDPAHHSRNICVFANAEVDRSPTGTGVSGRLAIHYAKGELVEDQLVIIESIVGAASTFSGRVAGRTKIGSYDAVIPEVSGTAFITGRHEFLIDPRDELGKGFLLSTS